MNKLTTRIKNKFRKILRDQFGYFTPLGGRTALAVEYALKNNAGGHYYEFGLYQGYTFYRAVIASPHIHHFGFDSFEGMPDNSEGGGFQMGRFTYSYSRVINNLLKNKAFSHKEHLIKGFFSDSLTADLQSELQNYKPGVILIDSDLYSSAVEVLNFIKPLLQKGTIVIFDDWHAFTEDQGEQKALREFLSENKTIKFNEIIECEHRKMFKIDLVV
jgi:O-methyltransferase